MSEFLLSGSYLAIIVVIVLTGMGLPIPEEVPIIAAGVLSSHGQLDPWLAFAACLIGALLGDCASYWIGFHFGRSVIREHHWWARFVTPEREQAMELMIRTHGLKVFLVARFLVGFRSTIYLTAGILRMPFRRFLLIDLICATIVIGIFFGLSYLFGEVVTGWIRGAEWTVTGVVIGAMVIVGIVYWVRRRKRFAADLKAATNLLPPEDSHDSDDSDDSENPPEQKRVG